MSLFTTLEDMKKATTSSGGKNIFLTIKPNESKKIRFRQELPVVGAPEGDLGYAKVAMVHNNEDDFRKRTACTRHLDGDNGRCYGCEKGMYAVQHLVINIAVLDNETKEWEPKILDQKFTAAHVGSDLMEYFEEYGSICDRLYRFSRTGEQRQTNYSLIPSDKSDAPAEFADMESYDLSKTYPELSYEKQVDHHSGDSDELM